LFLSFRDSRARSTTRFGRSIRTYADDNDNDADDDDDERAGLIRGSNNNNGAGASGSRSPHVALDVDATLPPKWCVRIYTHSLSDACHGVFMHPPCAVALYPHLRLSHTTNRRKYTHPCPPPLLK
jgi:hypothetical protein